jgi:hypothetical protein
VGGNRWTNAKLDKMRQIGDPVADKVIEKIFARGNLAAVNELIATVVHDDCVLSEALPPDLRRYFERTAGLPPWADEQRIARAQEFFGEHGPHILLALLCCSLPSSYAAAKGVQVLALTGQLGSNTSRRIMETGQFLMDVMEPDGLGPKGRGVRTIQRVRLMHAAIRLLIREYAQQGTITWEPGWGIPVNQEDLAGTLMAFAFVVHDALPRLGADIDGTEAADYLHAWAVVGHMLGVRDSMIAKSVDDAAALVAAIERRHFAACEQGQDLTRALVDVLQRTAPDHDLRDLGPALIRYLVGDLTAAIIGLEAGTDSKHVAELIRVLDGVEEAMEHHEVIRLFAPRFARTVVRGLFAIERGPGRTMFAIPTTLADRWQLPDAISPRG